MVAAPWIVPGPARLNFNNATGLLAATAANYRLALVGSGWTPNNVTDELWSAASGSEIANGNGYTTGGLTPATISLSKIDAQTISSITRSGQTATVTTASAHGLSTGMVVTIRDAVDTLYNGTFVITVTGATTFTYTMTGTPAANASVVGWYASVIKWTWSTPSVWTASGSGIPAWRRAVLYYLGTLNSKVNPILAHMLGDSTGIDVPLTTSGNTITITPDAAGIIQYG